MINYLLYALVTKQTRIILPCECTRVYVSNYFVPIAAGHSYMRKGERSPRTGRATNNPFSRVYATPRTIDASFVEKRDQLTGCNRKLRRSKFSVVKYGNSYVTSPISGLGKRDRNREGKKPKAWN